MSGNLTLVSLISVSSLIALLLGLEQVDHKVDHLTSSVRNELQQPTLDIFDSIPLKNLSGWGWDLRSASCFNDARHKQVAWALQV